MRPRTYQLAVARLRAVRPPEVLLALAVAMALVLAQLRVALVGCVSGSGLEQAHPWVLPPAPALPHLPSAGPVSESGLNQAPLLAAVAAVAAVAGQGQNRAPSMPLPLVAVLAARSTGPS